MPGASDLTTVKGDCGDEKRAKGNQIPFALIFGLMDFSHTLLAI